MKLSFLLAAASVSAPVLLTTFSSPMNDYNFSTDRRERMMVFARSEADFRNARIYVARTRAGGWSEPQPIDFSDGRYSDSDPWLTPDGKTLYFISDRPAPGRDAARTDYDIWRASRTARGWSAPEHLGPEINGRGQELGPELHGGTLYFASARRSGLGGLDIYAASANGRGFNAAAPMAAPFNTASSESDFTLSCDGKAAMFWRSIGDRGMIHITYRDKAGWGEPVALPDSINIGPFNFTPSFSCKGPRIRYASTRERSGQPAGMADIYEATLPAR